MYCYLQSFTLLEEVQHCVSQLSWQRCCHSSVSSSMLNMKTLKIPIFTHAEHFTHRQQRNNNLVQWEECSCDNMMHRTRSVVSDSSYLQHFPIFLCSWLMTLQLTPRVLQGIFVRYSMNFNVRRIKLPIKKCTILHIEDKITLHRWTVHSYYFQPRLHLVLTNVFRLSAIWGNRNNLSTLNYSRIK